MNLISAIAFIFTLIVPWNSSYGDQRSSSPPNVLLIITDDQRYDDTDMYMPEVNRRIFSEGIRFHNAYVTTPLCCPSRSSIYTGMYASKHGVISNQTPLARETITQRLSKVSNYQTAMIGKYLNSSDGTPRPEFDYWVSHSRHVKYKDPVVNVNGKWSKERGYQTDIMTNHALHFLQKNATDARPFFLTLSYFGPHSPHIPADQDRQLYVNDSIQTPSFNELDVSDKPSHIQLTRPFNDGEIKALETLRTRQRQCLASIDRGIGRVLDLLQSQGRLDTTVVIFLSDNGILLGEHRLWGKRFAYEPAIRVPLAIRYPTKYKPQLAKNLVLNIDIAPTIYALTNTPPPYEMDGVPLLPERLTSATWRKDFMFEVFQTHPHQNPSFTALHTEQHVFVWHDVVENKYELYDLEKDPYQLNNLAHEEVFAPLREELLSKLKNYMQKIRGGVSLNLPQLLEQAVPETHIEDFKNRKRLLKLADY